MTSSSLDQITQSLVDEFVTSADLASLGAADRFERFVNYCVVSNEYSDTFDVEDVSAPGNEVGIDGIAVVVNGALVTAPGQITDLVSRNGYAEATFVFVSAKRSAAFSEAELGNLCMAVADFFGEAALPRTPFIDSYLEIESAVYANGSRFSRGLPKLRLYYVTTGRWEEPEVVLHRLNTERTKFEGLDIFSGVDIRPVGARELRELYFRTRNPVEGEFTLSQKVTMPTIPGVTQAYLGIVQARDYVRLITDPAGQIRKSLFVDNVRDFRGSDNAVNANIANTIRSDDRNRFAILNNGVTIVARELRVTGDKLYMKAYQVVNGGQTSHVIVNEFDALDESVWVPIRVIGTDDEDLPTAVITATNNQTPVSAQELNSRSQFERELEQYFNTFAGAKALYYERRSRQYSEVAGIEKVRIITRDQLVRAIAAMFLDEPHRATGYVPSLMEQLGGRLFSDNHRLEPYYAAAYGFYKLEFLWRNRQLDPQYKPGRWQVLMAARHLAIGGSVGQPNSNEIAKRAVELVETFWDDENAVELFKAAIAAVDAGTDGRWERDHMRNQPTTQDILLGLSQGG